MVVAMFPSLVRRLDALAVGLCLAAAGVFALTQLRDARARSAPAVPPPGWPGAAPADLAVDPAVFPRAAEHAPDPAGTLARRFRLAGTFTAVAGLQQTRKAVLDDRDGNVQRLVSEGDLVEADIRLTGVARDRVRLRQGAREETLFLSFATGVPGADAAPGQGTPPDAARTEGPGTVSRFGRQVADNRWLVDRAAVLAYYRELLAQSDRLAKVFESLKPVYQDQAIRGYTLDVEGEAELFSAFGLRQGDVIRTVNSMPMVSQSRAEYFIHEFVQDRVSAFVIDIERQNRPEKLVYLVR